MKSMMPAGYNIGNLPSEYTRIPGLTPFQTRALRENYAADRKLAQHQSVQNLRRAYGEATYTLETMLPSDYLPPSDFSLLDPASMPTFFASDLPYLESHQVSTGAIAVTALLAVAVMGGSCYVLLKKD